MRRLIPRVGVALVWLCVAFASSCATERRPVERAPRTSVDGPRPSGASYINGEVLGVDNTPAGDQLQMTLHLQVRPGDAPPVQVRLGPGWYFTERGITFDPHEPVEVSGTHSHDDEGHEVIIAHEVKKGGMTYRRDPGDESGQWHESPAAAAPATPAPEAEPEGKQTTDPRQDPADEAPEADEAPATESAQD